MSFRRYLNTVGHQSCHAVSAEATAAAAPAPSESNTSRPLSSSTGTPSVCALSSFDPAFSPATTNRVFFETEFYTLPPSSSMAAAASSRVRPGMVPVSTTVIPASRPAGSPGGGATQPA
jgi:hypothetical protein